MQTLNVKPTVPKTEPDRRDLMMREIEKASGWSVDKKELQTEQLSLYYKAYLSFLSFTHRITNPFRW